MVFFLKLSFNLYLYLYFKLKFIFKGGKLEKQETYFNKEREEKTNKIKIIDENSNFKTYFNIYCLKK